jgi:glycosyltransferase involved in cell wall biosynthesis
MKNILFITWDGAQTNYLEGLFLPIFNEIQIQSCYRFHIIQFTWANNTQTNLVETTAKNFGIHYLKKIILRKPTAIIGGFFTVFNGMQSIKKYIQKHDIDIVMPRSTIPAMLINRLDNKKFKLLFDADGFPLEERVDFSKLSKNSLQYQFLKKQETTILKNADAVITRSTKAISIHLKTLNKTDSEKFSVVLNGRNTAFFTPHLHLKKDLKIKLHIPHGAKILGYCGSLGAQYGWNEMVTIFEKYHLINKNSYFLILTGNYKFATKRIPQKLKEFCIVKYVPFHEIPNYLSIFDFAFAIREPKWSMQGVAPIKLGEYLLMGIPTIASAGIGDTEQVIGQLKECFLFHHGDKNAIVAALDFIQNHKETNSEGIRAFAMQHFSIEKSATSYLNALNKLL